MINNELENKNLTSTAFIIMFSVILSRIIGFVRTMLIPVKMGGYNAVTDAYNISFMIPDLLYSLIIGGAIAAAVIPILSGYIAINKEKEGWKAIGTFINIVVISMVVVSIIGIIFTPQLLSFIAKGYGVNVPEMVDLPVKLTRILFPSICFLMLAGICNGIMNSYHRFIIAAYGPSIYNILCVLSIVFLSNDNPADNYGVEKVVTGIVISAAMYFAFQLIFTFKHFKFYKFKLFFKHEGFIKLTKLAIPALLASSIMQLNIIISKSFTSFYQTGSMTALENANKTWQMPLGVVAQAMGIVLLPTLSVFYSKGKMDDFNEKFSKGIKFVLFLAVPSAVGITVLSKPLIRLIFKFSENITEENIVLTASILVFYSVALIAQSCNTMFNRAFYAMKNSMIPLLAGIAGICANILLTYIFTQVMEMPVTGISIAYSIATVVNLIILILVLDNRTGGLRNNNFVIYFLKVAVSAVIMGGAVYLFNQIAFSNLEIQQWFVSSAIKGKVIQGIQVLCSSIIGIVVYFTISYFLKVEESKELITKISNAINIHKR